MRFAMDKEAQERKADKLAQKINEISKKFDIADEITSDDVIDSVVEKTKEVELYKAPEITETDVVNLNNMVDDFKFVRESLLEIIKNGRKVLNTITLELLDSDSEGRPELISAFSELNNSITNNMKVYTNSYKEISTVLVNLEKIKTKNAQGNVESPNTVHNTLNINTTESINTAELIERFKNKK